MIVAEAQDGELEGACYTFSDTLVKDVAPLLQHIPYRGICCKLQKPLKRCLVSWNTLIHSFTRNSRDRDALEFYTRMLVYSLKPDDVTLIAIFMACNHLGLLSEALDYFRTMAFDHCMEATVDHYCSMLDVLGRAGKVAESEELLHNMPFETNHVAWTAPWLIAG